MPWRDPIDDYRYDLESAARDARDDAIYDDDTYGEDYDDDDRF